MKKKSVKNRQFSQSQSLKGSDNLSKNFKFVATLPELIKETVNKNRDNSIIFVDGVSPAIVKSYGNLLTSAEKILTGLRKSGLSPQDKLILLLSDNQELIPTFWACILGGFVPLIMEVPPTNKDSNYTVDKLKRIWELLERPLIISNTRFSDNFSILLLEQLTNNEPDKSYHQPQPDDIAFLTLSSGSTGTPKCIQLTHRNLIARTLGTNLLNQHRTNDIILNWLPFDHIGGISDWHIRPLALGSQLIYVKKEYILGNPLNWLNLINKYRVSHSWAPNFIYNIINDLVAEKNEYKWDLSCLQFLLTAGESINAKTVKNFLDRLHPYGLITSAIRPAFGMAELGSGITYSQPDQTESLIFHCLDKTSLKDKIKYTENNNPNSIIFTDLGKPIPGVSLRIVDAKNNILPENTIGNLQVKGDVVFPGYYQNSQANQEVFISDGWFKTGDLGFLAQGNLVVTGRAKETIIINGINYYSQEIEAIIEEISEIIPSYTAACAVNSDNKEELAIFFHCSVKEEHQLARILKNIRRQIISKVGIIPNYLIPVDKNDIPKTEIGKIKRRQLSQRFTSGEFAPIIEQVKKLFTSNRKLIQGKNNPEDRLKRIWQQVLSLDEIGFQDNFFELGGNSVLLIQLQHELETEFQQKIAVADLFQYPTIAAQTNYFKQQTSPNLKLEINKPKITTTGEIAVIGMSCRFPGAENIEQFWHNLCNGVESITFFSEEEILASGISPDLVRDSNYVKARPILKDVELFDAEFFGYHAKEAKLIDPQQRLLLECAWESLEDAGYNPFIYPSKIGIYAGAVMNTYLLNNVYPHRQQLDINDNLQVATLDSMGGFQMMVANEKDYLTTRISYKLNLTGPSVNIQTACSTSLVAIHLAKQSLLNGECDLALAGGVSLQIPQNVGYLYQEGMIVSQDGHCRAFDRTSNGTVFGNGVGLVVLKRLEEAIADGDNIYAVIKGSAINNDGGTKVGYLAPNGEGQSRAVAEAINNAGINADTIGYLETHGTGTLLGDPVEVAGLTKGFGVSTKAKQFCPIGSVKTNVGHLQIASGIAGFIKTVLCLHHKKIPPSLNFQESSPQIDFANSPFYVNTQLQDWAVSAYPRRAGVNSLGVGGTNAHVILEEAGLSPLEKGGLRGDRNLFTLSAKSESALQELVKRYQNLLAKNQYLNLADICFTTNIGRVHFDYRLGIVAESIQQLREEFKKVSISKTKLAIKKPITFLFSGQGCQYLNMGFQLYQTQPIFRQHIDYCSEIVEKYLGESLLNIIFSPEKEANKINQTLYTQVSIFAVEYALYQLWKSWGIEPTLVMGHSLGEYVAACVAGVFSVKDALKLLITRGKLVQALPLGEMVSVFTSLEQIQEIIKTEENVGIAAINSNSNIVISGTQESIKNLLEILENQGIKSKKLNISHAFHSPLMKEIVSDFKQVAEEVTYFLPEIEIISNLTGELVTEAIATPEYWGEHLYKTVQLADNIKVLKQKGSQIFIDCSPQPTLLTMVRWDEDDSLWLPSLRQKFADCQQILDSLAQLYVAGFDINWSSFHNYQPYQRVSLPTYPWQKQRYWIEPVKIEGKKSTKKDILSNDNINNSLLGDRLLSPLKEIIFQSFINLENFSYLKDHRLGDTIILPGAAYLEMACAAATKILKSSVINLEDVVIQKPLILSDSNESNLQLIIDSNSDKKHFEIYSLSQDETWNLHCTGKIKAHSNKFLSTNNNNGSASSNSHKNLATKIIFLAELKQKLSQFSLSVETHYQNCQTRGLYYGNTFQCIKQLWAKEGEALGKIDLSESLINAIDNYQIHPTLLDGCFQVLFAALPKSYQTETYLPISIDSLYIYTKPSTELWSYVKIQSKIDNISDIIKADLYIFDSSGNLVIEIKGLTSKRTNSNLLIKNTITPNTNIETSQEFWQNWLYKVEWYEQPLVKNKAIKEIGNWLIISNSCDLAEKSTKLLQSQQQKCYLANQENDLQILINKIKNSQLPFLGIVYIWHSEELSENSLPQQLKNALELVQALIKAELNQLPRLWLVTKNSQAIAENKLSKNNHINYAQLTQSCLWGLSKVINLEYSELNCSCVDLDINTNLEELFREICSEETENQVTFRQEKRFIARLNRHQINDFNQQPLRLDILEKGTLENLYWQPINRTYSNSQQVEIKVSAISLNFRDILNALDMYPGDAGLLGLECVGKIIAKGNEVKNFNIGDEVIAVAPGCFGNYATVNANLVIAKPNNLSYAEAATIPGAFLTAYYTLIHLAKLKKGQKILIHSGAGGVGLAAIKIAQKIGAEIFTTASINKWNFLKSLGIKHIFNSRNLDFAEEILAITEGKGVDVILNCLTGEFITKSLSILNSNGCFLEIGKQNIWNEKQVTQIKPAASYFIVDLIEIIAKQPNLIQQMLCHIIQEYQPLPHKIFPADKAKDAFRYMQQTKHIGKIIITFPETTLNSNATYLIAGGLGALGLTVAEWMVKKGAKNIVLISRNPVKDSLKEKIEILKQNDINLIIAQADIGDRTQVEKVFSKINHILPPLKGIIHAAGILDDAVLSQQTWESFEQVCHPKVQGAWNLHQLTCNQELDFFVMFSSIASLLGSAGQANYSAANTFLDALAHARQAMGLRGLSINWGAWSQIGLAADIEENLNLKGIESIKPEQALIVLEQLLNSSSSQVGVVNINWSKYLSNQNHNSFLENFAIDISEKEELITEKLLTTSPCELKQIIQNHVQSEVAKVLGIKNIYSLDLQQGFTELGMDSLNSVELRNRLQTTLKYKVSSTIAFDYPTIESLTNYLVEQLSFTTKNNNLPQNKEKIETKLEEIEKLSETDAEALLLAQLDKLSEI